MNRGSVTDASEPRCFVGYDPLPKVWKVIVVCWFAWTAIFVVGGTAGGIPIAALLAAVALLAGLAWFLRRRPHLGVVAYEDELVIRNALRERRVPRGEIAGFRIDTPRDAGAPGRPVVLLVKQDGESIPLWVTTTTPMNRKCPPTEKALHSLSTWFNN